jgi:diaminopimelate decarboxylase
VNYVYAEITGESKFFGNTSPVELVNKYGSPLFVYNENILRGRCRELRNLVAYKNFRVNYSPKANSSLELLKIVHDEGLWVDAMSPGEIFVNLKAGFKPEEIFYISNNVSEEEFTYAIEAGVKISVDSVSQLEMYGKLNPGGKVAIRINPGVGAGHHQKVVTGGKTTKFGIEMKYIPEVKEILKKYQLNLIGINQHIGSLFMEGTTYAQSTETILSLAKEFENLEFVDLGGGFGIPYEKQASQKRLNLSELGEQLSKVINQWVGAYGKDIIIKIEPGRYIAAECGLILGQVNTVKMNYGIKYIGTDIGFNVLMRPILYDSHHDIEIYRETDEKSIGSEPVRIVGNICESGDILAKDRMLPEIKEKDIIGVLDAGAYGYVMSSNYNNRLRPAEVLIGSDGNHRLIRRRDTFEDLVRGFEEV